ncbi:hypothetical protein hrd7_25210 [Leptolinea sp. HRD-7]|nr:hypothetical protein hrd7_25210 [Leptolinea sp. HRD-7]
MSSYNLPVFEGLKISSLYLLEPMTGDELTPGHRHYPNGIVLRDAIQRDGTVLWKIVDPPFVLNTSGQWEYEPMPSSRDDAFLKRCRFASIEAAVKAWNLSTVSADVCAQTITGR